MTRWKYCADQHDPLAALRIPVTSEYPVDLYTACFDRESHQRPTDAEARMIVSFIEEYQDYQNGDGWHRQQQLLKPFDMLERDRTKVFHKWAANDWSYRDVRWRSGPHWSPVAPRMRGMGIANQFVSGPLPLELVMDAIHNHTTSSPSLRWADWKRRHPLAFP